MGLRKKGSYVYVSDAKVLKDSFSSWLPCRVFKVSEHKRSSDGKRYVWVESYSIGLDPKSVVTATPAQVSKYHAEKKAGVWVDGATGRERRPERRRRRKTRPDEVDEIHYIPVRIFISSQLSEDEQRRARRKIMRDLAKTGFSSSNGMYGYEKKPCRIKDVVNENDVY